MIIKHMVLHYRFALVHKCLGIFRLSAPCWKKRILKNWMLNKSHLMVKFGGFCCFFYLYIIQKNIYIVKKNYLFIFWFLKKTHNFDVNIYFLNVSNSFKKVIVLIFFLSKNKFHEANKQTQRQERYIRFYRQYKQIQ